MADSLKDSAISGAKWNALLLVSKYLITFLLSIVLARALSPLEFGLTGMLSIFVAIASIFIDSGFLVSLVRIKDTVEEDFSTVFYFNIAVSSIIYILIYFCSPLIASFYSQPILIPLSRLISLVFLINSFGIVQNAIFIKSLNFKTQSICNLVGIAVSAVVAMFMVYKDFGVYSIVGQVLSQSVVTNLMFWISSKWRPRTGIKLSSLRKLWKFASNIFATNIVGSIVDNVDNLIIGKFFPANNLGLYIRAKSMKSIPQDICIGVLNIISFPVLTKLSNNSQEFNRLHLKFYNIAIYVYIPIVIGFIAVSKAFTIVLYTEKWLSAVPYFQIIMISSVSFYLDALFNQTLMAKGAGRLYFKLFTAKKMLLLICTPIGAFIGIIPFIWAFVIMSFIGLMIDFYFTRRLLGFSATHYYKPLIRCILISIPMGVVSYSISMLPIENELWTLFLQIFIGVLVYIFLSMLARINEFYILKQIAKEQLSVFVRRLKH